MSDTAIVSAPEFDEHYEYEYVGNGKWKKIPRAARFDELQKVIDRVEHLEMKVEQLHSLVLKVARFAGYNSVFSHIYW